MVPLGLGQAILGGKDGSGNHQKKIYFMTCSNRNCIVTPLPNELSHPIENFVAIPISDLIAGCISEGNMLNSHFQKINFVFLSISIFQFKIAKSPHLLEMVIAKMRPIM